VHSDKRLPADFNFSRSIPKSVDVLMVMFLRKEFLGSEILLDGNGKPLLFGVCSVSILFYLSNYWNFTIDWSIWLDVDHSLSFRLERNYMFLKRDDCSKIWLASGGS